MDLKTIQVKNPDELNFIFGHSHFIKTVEDIHEALVTAVPGVKFGLAFCEASQDRLVRTSGTDDALTALAAENAMAVGAGHSFFLFLRDCFPINVLKTVQAVPEVCRIFCATANPVEVIVASTDLGNAVLGVVDGNAPLGVEGEADVQKRKDFLRAIGYKL